jgi:two-component system, NtrC family, response regulator AtoC
VRDIPIAARIISATNRDIEGLVRSGRFREDLYYRLNVVRIDVPPLRERREDVPLLAGHILEKLRARSGRPLKTLAPDALDALLSYRFPGNVRELENLLERATIISEGGEITAADLDLGRHAPRVSTRVSTRTATPAAPAATPLKPMEEMERDALARALEKHGGNRTRAAEELGISRRTILNKIKHYGL